MSELKVALDSIQDELTNYICEKHPSNYSKATLPRDKSLIELGIIDSFGVVELVSFIEEHWNIVIDDAEITTENMGGIGRMSTFIAQKLIKTS